MFIVVAVFIIPLVFMTGSLAVFAHVGRRDLALVISWMREGTKKAQIAEEEEQQIIARLHSEQNVAEALRLLRQKNEKGDVSLLALVKLIEDASKSRKLYK